VNNVVAKIKINKCYCLSEGRKTKMINKINDYSIIAYEKGRSLKNHVLSVFKQKEGQGMVEYALIVGLISVVAIIALTAVGTNVKSIFNAIKDKLVAAPTE
jgi:pilus assembly protein Flp/PilA